MKRIIVLLCIVSFLLSGCVLHRTSVIQVRGGEIEGAVWSYVPVKGKDIVITWIKETFFTSEKGRKLQPLLQMYLNEKGEAKLED